MPRSRKFSYGNHLTDGRRYGVLVEDGDGQPLVLWHDGSQHDADAGVLRRTTSVMFELACRYQRENKPTGSECPSCKRYVDYVRGQLLFEEGGVVCCSLCRPR